MPAFVLNPTTTALVLIDLQRGIVGLPLAPHSSADVLARSARLAGAFRTAGATVAYVRVDLAHLAHPPVDQPLGDPNAPKPPAAASELVPESGCQEGDLLVTKHQWGAFYRTDLDPELRRRGVNTVVLGGLVTNFGVESTARAAFDQGYAVVFAEDAMSSVAAEAHGFAVRHVFPYMGRVRSSDDIAAALASPA